MFEMQLKHGILVLYTVFIVTLKSCVKSARIALSRCGRPGATRKY
ncbi:hypothetical protein SAMN02982985_05188 [Rugamonas rubra]|uniref:Uncharacterized protein n=1 Tax=Rugamonas rubra TaxID=758825 RepID=A0A1I4TGC2_9BURK|nr:hypothetical protein SAMN02982985_05188 [Rugamonas rubra]